MEYKSIMVWPIIRPDQHYTRKELWDLKQEIKKVFTAYGTASCTYYRRLAEPTIHGYRENFAIVDFKRKEQARKALRALEQAQVYVNKTTVTAKPIELYDSPISRLPDECLLHIFNQLTVYEKLKLQKICTRWKRISKRLWRNVSKIDLREKSPIVKDKNYIANSGPHLRDIYCYDDHGLKIISKYCPNVESVAIEFRKYTKIKGLDRACIKYEIEILPKLNHLTRLMLKIRNHSYTYFEFLRHLPVTMKEIHLLNGINGRVIPCWDMDQPKIPERYHHYGRKLIDLSRFTNLQALTLKAYIFDESSLVGLEKLKKLTCLCLDDCMLSQTCVNQLKCFTDLQHLSLRKVKLYYNDAWKLLNRNPNLTYLCLPLLIDEMHYNDIWLLALELTKLKTLCWAYADRKIREIGGSTSIENMELHDVYISDRRFLLMLETFPNLKVVKRTSHWGNGSHYSTSGIQFAILNRPNKSPFRFYPGKLWKNPMNWYLPPVNYNKENFQHFDEVSPEDGRILRCGEWHGWYIDDDSLGSLGKKKKCSTLFLKRESYNNTTIEQLPDEHLTRIFSYLSIDDKSMCSDVCKRWEKIVNENSTSFTKFDVRQLSDHSKKTQCLLKYGEHFEDVYSYKSCGFLALKKYCPNIKSLAVDFGVKRCDCKTSSSEFYGVKSLVNMLISFKHLTKLMIKDVTAFCSDIFEYFPENLEELHIFNRNPRKIMTAKKKEPTIERRNISINLSRLKNLKALTLVQANLPVDELFDGTVAVIGLEKMKNLLHLRLSGDIFIVNPDSLIRNPLPLEYLSLTQSTITSSNLPFLMKYENIQYLDITDSFTEMEKTQMLAILSLERLRIFRMAIITPDTWPEEREEEEWQFDFIPALPHLEILDCQGHAVLLKNIIESVIASSPNLKIVNVPVSSTSYIEEILSIAESALMNKNNESLLNIFLGMRGHQICQNLRLRVAGVKLSDVPPLEYYKLYEKLLWSDWSTKNEAINIDDICKNLIKSVN